MTWKHRIVIIEFKDGTRPMRVSYYTPSDDMALDKAKVDYEHTASKITLEVGN